MAVGREEHGVTKAGRVGTGGRASGVSRHSARGGVSAMADTIQVSPPTLYMGEFGSS